MADPRVAQSLKDLLERQGLGGGPGDKSVRVRRTSAQTISDNSPTLVSWQAEDYDTDTMFPGSGTDVTVKTAGKWYLSAVFKWEDGGFANIRRIEFLVDGTVESSIEVNLSGTAILTQRLTDILDLSVDEVVTVRVFQTSSASIDLEVLANVSPIFKMQLLATP